MSIKTYLLDDEMFAKLTRMSLEITSKQPSTAIQSVDEQLKTFDLHEFKQSSATVTGSKTDMDFPLTQLHHFESLNDTGRILL
jgi:hypothetical protein